MAQQPVPAIGSVTFLFHLLVLLIAKLKRMKSVLYLTGIFIVGAILGGLTFRYLYVKNHSKIIHTTVVKKQGDEKTEAISDLQFIKGLHFIGWLPWFDEERSIVTLQQSAKSIDILTPIWYKITKEADLAEQPTKLRSAIETYASQSGILVMPAINNESDNGFDGKRVSKLISNKSLETAFINKAVKTAIDQHYSGWDIDFEQKNPNESEKFSAFIKSFSEELHNKHLKLSVTVQAKYEESDARGESNGEAWKDLALYADQIRVMAYDFHYDSSEPGPVTPLDDLENVLDYAVKMIPREKLVLGVAMYGYDWDERKGEAIQYTDALDRLKKYNGDFIRDEESQEIIGKYVLNGIPHTLWFTDTKSVIRILYIAHNYNVDTVSFWRLGGDDGQLWKYKQ